MDSSVSFYIYIFVVITAILGGSYYFFSSKNSISGGIYGLGSLVLSIYFGARWFLASGVSAANSGPWPPVINVCPDFLSLMTVDVTAPGAAASRPEKVCVDTIGISPAGGITKWIPGSTGEEFLFHLYAGDPDRKTKLCTECSAKKVTWEGIYDGTSCSSNVPPLPPV